MYCYLPALSKKSVSVLADLRATPRSRGAWRCGARLGGGIEPTGDAVDGRQVGAKDFVDIYNLVLVGV